MSESKNGAAKAFIGAAGGKPRVSFQADQNDGSGGPVPKPSAASVGAADAAGAPSGATANKFKKALSHREVKPSIVDVIAQDKKEKKDRERERNRRTERSIAVTKIEEEDLEDVIGPDWKTTWPTRLDFSSNKYKLETLSGMEVLRPRLNRLNYLELSNNVLQHIDYIQDRNGYETLIVLMAKRNLIHDCQLHLRRLQELNLSYNKLAAPPDLSTLPNLEWLILSHNLLSGSFQSFKHGHRLKHLDLAYNDYKGIPSELNRNLDYLRDLKSLDTLRLYANPFVRYFQEYQIFVVWKIPSIMMLDDVRITRTLRRDVMTQELYAMDVYDEGYKKRKTKIDGEDRLRQQQDTKHIHGESRCMDIVHALEDILDDPSVLQEKVDRIHEDAVKFVNNLERRIKADADINEDYFWDNRKSDIDVQERNALVAHLVELIIGIMERHESARPTLMDTIGYLTAVTNHNLGSKCMQALAKMMTGSATYKTMAETTLKKIVLKNIKLLCKDDLKRQGQPPGKRSKSLMDAVNGILSTGDGDLMESISIGLQDVLEIIKDWFEQALLIFEAPHFVKALARLTVNVPNAKLVACKELAIKCFDAITNKSIAEAEKLRGLYKDVLDLAENLVIANDEAAIETFVKMEIHVKTLQSAKDIIGNGKLFDKDDCQPFEAGALAKIFNLIMELMKRRPNVRKECVDNRHILEMLCLVLAKNSIDPLVLKAGCEILVVILEDKEIYASRAIEVVQGLRQIAPMLDFMVLSDTKFQDLFFRAMRHSAETTGDAKLKADLDDGEMDWPTAGSLNNTMVCEAFIGIIKLIAFFAEKDDPNDKCLLEVNDAMNNHSPGREQVLLELLLVPNDEVKIAVMECIIKTPPDQIDLQEMGLIVKTISETRNIGEGKAEKVMALLVKQMGRLAGDQGETGAKFRANYAKIAIPEVYDNFCINVARDSHGNEDEEDEKNKLSVEIVDFLRLCGNQQPLRETLRKTVQYHKNSFDQIMTLEEVKHRALIADVALEQTWIGRFLSNLMDCMNGRYSLSASSKVMVRVLSRMANVIEGRSDGLRTSTKKLKEISQMEARMFERPVQLIMVRRRMDNEEAQTLETEAIEFVRKGAIDIIRKKLSSLDVIKAKQELLRKARGNERREAIKEIESYVDKKQKELDDEEKGQAANTDMQLVGEQEKEYPDDFETGRDVLMKAVQRSEVAVDVKFEALFTERPDAFEHYSNNIFKNVEEKEMNGQYSISAFLRILYSLIVIPPNEKCREYTLGDLRDLDNMATVVAIVEQVPCLSCNVAAKFLHMMEAALRMWIFQPSDNKVFVLPEDPLIYFKVLSTYIKGHAENMMFLVKLTKERLLKHEEQQLCAEMARFMATLMRGIPQITEKAGHTSEQLEVEKGAIEQCTQFLVDLDFVKLLIGIIIYDLQMDLGGGARGDIHENFVRHAYKKVCIKEEATDVLAQLIVRWPDIKYAVLEQFGAAEVFDAQVIRPCYLAELLDECSLLQFRAHVQHWLRQPQEEEDKICLDLHIVFFELVSMQQLTRGGAQTVDVVRILCATTHAIYLLSPSADTPAYKDSKSETWVPNWESNYPRNPTKVWTRKYSELKNMYRSIGSQLLAMAWKDGTSDFFAFHRGHHSRDRMCNFVRRCSGKDRKRRAHTYNEPMIKEEIFAALAVASGAKENAEPPQLLAVSVATRGGCGIGPKVYVLTGKAVYEFNINFANWKAPEDSVALSLDDDYDFVPKDLETTFEFSACDEVEPGLKEENAALNDLSDQLAQPSERQEQFNELLKGFLENYPSRKSIFEEFGWMQEKGSFKEPLDKKQLEKLKQNVDGAKAETRQKIYDALTGGQPASAAQGQAAEAEPTISSARGAAPTAAADVAGQRSCNPWGGGNEQKKKKQAGGLLMSSDVLTLASSLEIKGKERITFDNKGEAELEIEGNVKMGIRFFDDFGREQWRRALAYVLTKMPTSWGREM